MAQLAFIQNIAAGATFDPLTQWQYRYAPRAGTFSVMLQQVQAVAVTLATTVLRATVSSGSDTLMEESPLQNINAVVVGTFLPRPDINVPLVDGVDGGDLLKILIRNTGAGAVDVAGIVEFN
jgi:hypothetical protein